MMAPVGVRRYRTYIARGRSPQRTTTITLGWLQFDSLDWSIAYRTGPTSWQTVGALRCGSCRRWTLGCAEHWFCGQCEACRRLDETDGEGE